MLNTPIRQAAIRVNAIDVAATLFGRWHETQRGRLMPPEQLHELIAALSDEERSELEAQLNELPDAEIVATIIALPAKLRSIRPLHAEDRRFVSEYRCWLIDAAEATQLGEYADAAHHVRLARDKIHWLVYKRSRGLASEATDYRWRSIDTAMRNELIAFISELDKVVTILDRAARRAS